jgi:hypothetical protein
MIYLPLLLQGLLMLIDEFYFHRRRGLGAWERIGHPLDTLSFLAPIGVAAFLPLSGQSQFAFIAFSAFSSLLITKDEFVHSRECEPVENWLHAMLFVLHPTCLFSVFLLWQRGQTSFLLPLFSATLLFGAYQSIYWNLVWRPGRAA